MARKIERYSSVTQTLVWPGSSSHQADCTCAGFPVPGLLFSERYSRSRAGEFSWRVVGFAQPANDIRMAKFKLKKCRHIVTVPASSSECDLLPL